MKVGTKGKAPSPNPAPDLSQALQVQELRTYIERNKPSEARFKDAQGLRNSRPSSAVSTASASAHTPSSLSSFLSELGLSKYLAQLLKNGIEDLETAYELTESDLEQMGIALGHRIKILKRLRELYGTREETKTSKVPSKPPLPPTLPQPEALSKPVHSAKVAGNSVPEALIKPVHPAKEAGNSAESGHGLLMSVNERIGCWECYRTFFKEVGEVLDGKVFCTRICAEKYRQKASVTCPCGLTQLKSSSVYSEGVYYCSVQCLPVTSGERTTSAGSGVEEPCAESLPYIVDKADQADIDDRASEDYSVTSKLTEKYRNRGQATIKEISFEGTLPDMRILMESVKELSGWDVPADATFDLEREDA